MAGEQFDDLVEQCNCFCDCFPKAEYGAAHVVISDFNFEDCFVQPCLDNIRKAIQIDRTNVELIATEVFLAAILQIPESERICPEAG